ncbi:hypothetical protein D6C84_05554 [Aureobasidium pullulans]|uniref:Xylanolytic transcriptional activator regulatory domain-containing protein n=1 Tax=Aureobasidium pullulans TaxID=5580 RepID=A0A4S9XWI4_AURPU|nr:hypothetical protein D6C84_05554 [Aureobasidium pullulans]
MVNIVPDSIPVTEIPAGPAFESQVRTLLSSNCTPNDMDVHSTSDQHARLSGSLGDMLASTNFSGPPSQEESYRLLDLFLVYLGVSQHFLDPRIFSDNITLFHLGEPSQVRLYKSMWYVQYLLVMAMGKLLDGQSGIESSSRPPGWDYFAEAMRLLPPLGQLRETGVVAVEILAVLTTYLQWTDWPDEAYLYVRSTAIGIALRLATALGCFRASKDQDCLPSESNHRVRLWWTINMLDKRLSASLACPAGIDDRNLSPEMPSPSVAFQSPVALTINIRIAKTTGEIMTSLYKSTATTHIELVQTIQNMLRTLFDIGQSFPPELVIDFASSPVRSTRTAASLHLMLYQFQAILLCIRPVVLQQVHQKLRESTEDRQVSPIVLKLTRTCEEAAMKCVVVLSRLKQNIMIARFGFFDLDATFSAAFVLIMLRIEDGKSLRPPDEILEACRVLQYLSIAGNRMAGRRLRDINDFCTRVWPTASSIHETLGILMQPHARNVELGNDMQHQHQHQSWQPTSQIQQDTFPYPTIPIDTAQRYLMVDEISNELVNGADDIYFCFNDPTLALTGIDLADWIEMSRTFDTR